MTDEQEPPALSSSSSSASSSKAGPPVAAFSKGGPPPSATFSHSSSRSNYNTGSTHSQQQQQQHTALSSDDLNSRWKKYEAEMEEKQKRGSGSSRSSSISGSGSRSKNSSTTTDNKYNLYETPEKLKRSASLRTAAQGASYAAAASSTSSSSTLEQPLEPRRTYSFTKSSSYTNANTAAIMAKYAGVAGMPPGMSSAAVVPASASSRRSSAASVREEAMKVLAMANESTATSTRNEHQHQSQQNTINQPINVARTESGGFRAVVGDGNTKVRTPSALAGLGLGFGGGSPNRSKWKSGRYSFSDPQFREDDYYDHEDEEEDNIVRPVPPFMDEDTATAAAGGSRRNSTGAYLDHRKNPTKQRLTFESIEFEGDFPSNDNGGDGSSHPGGKSSSWSSRYSDNPRMSNSKLLDRWDSSNSNGNTNSQQRQSARNMFMSTASTVRAAAETVVSKSVSSGGRVFGAGFSFRQSHRFGNTMPTSPAAKERNEGPNLREIWHDDDDDDAFHDEHTDVGIGGRKGSAGRRKSSRKAASKNQHKTWESVMHEKKRRRKIGISMLLCTLVAIIIGVSLSKTSDQWDIHKRFFNGSDKGLEVTFYATSNTDGGLGKSGSISSQQHLEQDLQTIPNDAEFIAHLGNLQDASITQCPANRNDEVASILRQSPVPVFIVPGEHDWLKCPTQNYSFSRWMNAFQKFTETSFADHKLAKDIVRPHTTPELFAALHSGVLFIGLHLVNGSFHTDTSLIQYQGKNDDDAQKLDIKEEKTKIFIRGMLDSTRGEFRAIVLMGNARPSPQQVSFFTGIAPYLQDSNVPVMYLHSDSNRAGTTQHYPFASGIDDTTDNINEYLKNLLAVQVPNGGIGQSPLRISIGYGKKPFHIG